MIRILVPARMLHAPRLHYTLDVLFKQMLGLDCLLQAAHLPQGKDAQVLISYGPRAHPKADLHIPEEGLLSEKGVRPLQIQTAQWGEHSILFPQKKQSENSLPFDLFAAAFFLLSRYEEYLPFQGDEHARFPLSAAILHGTSYPEKPLIHYWMEALLEILRSKHPLLKPRLPAYSFRPSYDTDLPWCLINKRPLQALGGSLRDLLQNGPRALLRRYRIWRKPETDPCFTFPFLQKTHKKLNLHPIYFAPTSNYGRYDKSPSHRNPAYRNLLKQLAREGEIGLHPSYKTLGNPCLLTKEKQRLEEITNRPVTQSRQHYLRFRFPQTPRQLLEAGISHDYSLGFAERPGFRMACCIPIPWYDIEEEKQTSLTLHALPLMDVSLLQYLQLNAEERERVFSQIFREIKKFGGEFTPLWHNNNLTTDKKQEEYENFLRLASA